MEVNSTQSHKKASVTSLSNNKSVQKFEERKQLQVDTKHENSSQNLENKMLAMRGMRQSKVASTTGKANVVKGIKVNKAEKLFDVSSQGGQLPHMSLSMDSVEDMFMLNVQFLQRLKARERMETINGGETVDSTTRDQGSNSSLVWHIQRPLYFI